MSADHIALLRQQQVLIMQIENATRQLAEVNKALFPPIKEPPKKWNRKEWEDGVKKRMNSTGM
jgi:hypothetical protein